MAFFCWGKKAVWVGGWGGIGVYAVCILNYLWAWQCILVLADGQKVFNRGCVRGNAGALWECDLRGMFSGDDFSEMIGGALGGDFRGMFFGKAIFEDFGKVEFFEKVKNFTEKG